MPSIYRRCCGIDVHKKSLSVCVRPAVGTQAPLKEEKFRTSTRDLTRLRVHWLEDLNRMKNRIGHLCEADNVNITSVASDLFGVSGRRMLASLVEGQRSAGWMADYARGTLRSKRGQWESALQGTLTVHQREVLMRLLE